MGKINRGRVILGGLLGGVIVIAIEMVMNGVFFGNEWKAVLTAYGHPPAPSGFFILLIFGFTSAIGMTWLYAVARARFGPGPRTAVLTGCAFWVFGYGLPTLGLLSFQLFPPHLPIVSAAAGVAEAILASLVGAWLYKE